MTRNHLGWQVCRERRMCLKPPARPPTFTGLDFSESVYVREFDEAVYKCLDPKKVGKLFTALIFCFLEFNVNRLLVYISCKSQY